MISIIPPYVNMSKETDPNIVARNKEYMNILYSFAWTKYSTPIMPVLEYSQLPKPFIKKDLLSEEQWLKHCGWFEGKTPCWRDYDPLFNSSSLILVPVDFGLSDGMKKIIEKYSTKVKLVTLQGFEKLCDEDSEEIKFFSKYSPIKIEEEKCEKIWE